MGRPPRIDYEGAWHHVMNRGLARTPIFDDDEDCIRMLALVDDLSQRYRLEVHGFALIPNHYHLLLRSRGGLLSQGMAHLSSRYTRFFNRRHGRDGPLFRGRFRSRLVQDEDYLTDTLAYVHLNPVKAGLVKRPDDLCWTSHRAYMGLDSRPPWLRCDDLLALYGDAENLDDHMRALWQGSERWAADLALDMERLWAAYGRASGAPPAAVEQDGEPPREAEGTDAVLNRIEVVTGCSRAELMEAHHGRGANPARRFAIWALSRDRRRTNADVAEILGATTNQVNLVLSRLRRRRPVPLDGWMDLWDDGAA